MNAHMRTSAPVNRPNLKGAVADRIRDLILSGQLKPGTKIDQDEIADELGVSKLPVREALISLETEGLIHSIPRRGAFVAALSRQDVYDHYSIYGMIAGLAAERAADMLTEGELKELEGLLETMEASGSPSEQEEINNEFHSIINRAGGSRRLKSILMLLSKSIPTRFFLYNPGWADSAHHDHRRILDALCKRDGRAARDELERHLSDSANHAVAILEQRGFWGADDESDVPDVGR